MKKREPRSPAAWLALYAEDLLLVCGFACLTAAAALRFGPAGALAVAGLCLTVCAVVVAKAKGGGNR